MIADPTRGYDVWDAESGNMIAPDLTPEEARDMVRWCLENGWTRESVFVMGETADGRDFATVPLDALLEGEVRQI